MTTIAEEKASILSQINSLASGVLAARYESIEAMELAEELLQAIPTLTIGVSSGYHDFATFYGKQRAILRGLPVTDALFHTINDPLTYQDEHDFTLPTLTQFGYVVLDDAGNEVVGWAAADYYLTKHTANNELANTLANPDGFVSPIVAQSTELAKAGTADGSGTDWQALTAYKASTLVVPTTPNGFFFKVIQAGTSNSAEPTWPTTIGATVVDGGVTWINAGRLITEWGPSIEYRVSDRVYPATPMGDYFQATPAKEVAATHAGSPDRMALVATTVAPGTQGVPVTRLGTWQSIRGPNSAIQQFSFVTDAGTDRLLVYVSGIEDLTVDKPIRLVTYGGKTLTRVVTASADSLPGIGRAELWILKEADLALAVGDDFIVSYAVEGDLTGVAAHGCVLYQNVNQETPIAAKATAADPGPAPTNPLTTNLNIVGNSMQVAVVWANVDGGFTWNPEWDRQLNVDAIPGGGASMSVADSDDVVGTSDSAEPASWPVTLGGLVADGNITWKNIGSTVMPKTTANPMVPGMVSILVDGVLVGIDDGAGNIVDASGFTLIDSGSVTYATGVVSVTFDAPQVLGELVSVRYDAIINLTEWEATYEQLSFTTSSTTYGSSSQYTLKLVDLLSGDIGTIPELLTQMKVRDKVDHSVLGTMIVMAEGLEANPSWDNETDPPEDATMVTHAEFKLLLGYMNPDTEDDIVKSADLNNVSNGQEDPADTYPNIELNPMFPATQGNHEALQPSGVGLADAFAGNYAHVEDRGSPEVRWFVLTGIRFSYGTQPTAADLLAFPLDPPQNNPDAMDSGLQAIQDQSTAGTNPVPADVSDTTRYSLGAYTGGTYISPTPASEGSRSDNNRVYISTWTGGGGGFVSSVLYSCLWNDLQDLRTASDGVDFIKTQVDAIQALGNITNTIDNRATEDDAIITDTATFETPLDAWLAYHLKSNYHPIDDRPSSYVLTTFNDLVSPAAVYQADIIARLIDLDDVLGDPIVGGGVEDYAKIMYDAANLAVNTDIGYMRRVLDKLDSIQALYDVITQSQQNYAAYP